MAAERKFIAENVRRVLLKEYLMKEVSRAGFGGLDVQRTPMGTSVVLSTERPGLVIGRRGQTIKTLTSVIEEHFGFDNPQIEVHEVENPNLNAQIMAEKLAFSLERGWHFRRAGHSSVRRIMESGAKGCHIIIAGKLTGQRKRTEKFKDGYIKFCGEPKLEFMTKGYAVAKMKQGIIGVTVEIMRADARLPADVTVLSKTEAAEILPDLIAKGSAAEIETPVEEVKAESTEIEAKPKKATKKKAEPKAEATEAPAEEVKAEPVKKAAKKKAEPKAEAAEVPAEEVKAESTETEAKPKKVTKKKAEPKAEATEAPAEEVKAEPVKKATKEKSEPKAEATEADAKPKKTVKKKAEPKAESTETEAKPKKAAKKKADADKEAQ